MLLLSAPFEPGASAPASATGRACLQVGGSAALLVAAGLALEWLSAPGATLGHALASGAVHGGFLGLGWLIATAAAPGWAGPVLRLGATVIAVSLLARWGPLGPFGFLLVPGLLLVEARHRPRLRAIGLGGARWLHALAGLALGGFLGAHLLVTASRTLGYRMQESGLATYLGALAYDAGVNALSAEWLFRGAIFSLLWRRWTFWPAALLTTALSILRYLLDPALPHAPEARAGAVFYVGLVGLIACSLRAWSGSLLPGYLATVGFFAAYRMLAP